MVKQLWGFAKVRYRGLAKNLARAETMFALANLYQLRRELLSAGGEVRVVNTIDRTTAPRDRLGRTTQPSRCRRLP